MPQRGQGSYEVQSLPRSAPSTDGLLPFHFNLDPVDGQLGRRTVSGTETIDGLRDNHKLVFCSGAATVTLPNDAPAGFRIICQSQDDASKPQFATASGATAVFEGGATYSYITGNNAEVTVTCFENSDGSSAKYRVTGSTST